MIQDENICPNLISEYVLTMTVPSCPCSKIIEGSNFPEQEVTKTLLFISFDFPLVFELNLRVSDLEGQGCQASHKLKSEAIIELMRNVCFDA